MLSNSIRICHLGKYYPPIPGGMESHVQTLALAQAALGAQVRVICVNHVGNVDSNEMDGPVQVHRMGRRHHVPGFDFCPRLASTLRRISNVDLFHVHTPNPTMLLALLRVRPNKPVVITHHSDVIRQKIMKHALVPLEWLAYRRARRILATSPRYVECSGLLQRFQDKLESLPLGLDPQRLVHPNSAALAQADQLRRAHGKPLWLTVGRLVYYKGLEVAIQALQHVPGTLMIVGTGPLQKQLVDLAKSLNVADRIIWKGHATDDELVGAYHAATAFWFPSNARSEGFGLVQVEAMACRCPVINTAIVGSGVPWVSVHEETGLTVPINDPRAFAAAANRLLDEPGLRERLAAAGRQRALREFDHKVMAQHSLEIYRQVLSLPELKIVSEPALAGQEVVS